MNKWNKTQSTEFSRVLSFKTVFKLIYTISYKEYNLSNTVQLPHWETPKGKEKQESKQNNLGRIHLALTLHLHPHTKNPQPQKPTYTIQYLLSAYWYKYKTIHFKKAYICKFCFYDQLTSNQT